jgi:hypothetical protein
MATITTRANARAQRRFRHAFVRGVITDGQAPETRRWIEAEQLVTRLREWARMSEAQLDAAHEAAVADLEDLRVRDGLPDVPLADPDAVMLAYQRGDLR